MFVARDAQNNLYLSYQERYQIEVYAATGAVLRKISRQYEPRALTEDEKEKSAERPVFVLNNQKFFRPVPAFHQDIQGLHVTPSGEIWVLTSERRQDRFVVDGFNEQGQFVRQMLSEYDFPFKGRGRAWEPGAVWKGNKVYAIRTTETGLIQVVCFSVKVD